MDGNFPYKGALKILSVPKGSTWRVSVSDIPNVRVGAGIIYSFAVIGGADKPLQLVPVVDARGATQAPVGAAATGGGGTAGDHESSLHEVTHKGFRPHDRRRPSK